MIGRFTFCLWGNNMLDEHYMRCAIELAKRGQGWTNPNPMVGAVIVKGDRVIGQGWHEKYGQPHAERNALSSCTERLHKEVASPLGFVVSRND